MWVLRIQELVRCNERPWPWLSSKGGYGERFRQHGDRSAVDAARIDRNGAGLWPLGINLLGRGLKRRSSNTEPLARLFRARADSGPSVLRHGALALGISLVGSLLAFLAQVGLARAMNAQQYGVYAYAFAWISLLSTIGTVGFEPTLLRFVSVLREQGEFAALRAVIRYAERCSVLVSAALVLAAATAIWLLRERLSAELMVTFAIGLLVIPATALMRLRSSVVRVFGRLALSLIPGSSLRELMLVIAAVAMLLGALPIAYSAVAMGVVLLASVLGLAAVSAGVQRSLLPESHACAIATSISATPPEGAARAWLRPALFLLVFITTNLLLKRTDILVIGWLLGTEQAGVYAVAIYIAGLVVLPVTAIGTVFAPVVAALHAEQRMGVLQEKASAAAWWGIAAGVIPRSRFIHLRPDLAGDDRRCLCGRQRCPPNPSRRQPRCGSRRSGASSNDDDRR